MNTATLSGTTKRHGTPEIPYFVSHDSFETSEARANYGPVKADDGAFREAYMPDEVTRDCARRMHYAAWRFSRAGDFRARVPWKRQYLSFRDRIVLGNHKLIYRAVRRWMPGQHWADDMIGDCQVVLIQAVAAYNPWIGVRFSTYAFTCLMRALSRLSQRRAADRLSKSLSLDALPDDEPRDMNGVSPSCASQYHIDEFLRESHGLLSSREKQVLVRRFQLDERTRAGTLEQVGRELGLSKERVRQVQASALGKLREALREEAVC